MIRQLISIHGSHVHNIGYIHVVDPISMVLHTQRIPHIYFELFVFFYVVYLGRRGESWFYHL